MKVILKRQIKGWEALSKDQKRRIIKAVEKKFIKFPEYCMVLILCVIMGAISGFIEKSLGRIGADEPMWLGLVVLLFLACINIVVYNVAILNPKIAKAIKNEKDELLSQGKFL